MPYFDQKREDSKHICANLKSEIYINEMRNEHGKSTKTKKVKRVDFI
jgi:hypothetical protein